MIKIAYVVGGLPFGGVENWLFDIAKLMKNSNEFTCKIFNVSGTGLKIPEFYDSGLCVENIGTGNKSASSHRLDTTLSLRNKLKMYSPDIVHTMHYSGDYFGRISSIGLSVPILTHVHNTKREIKISRRISNKILSYWTDCFLSVSKAVEVIVGADHDLFKRKKVVIYNGIDVSRLQCDAHDLRSMYALKGKIIVGVGRYVCQKNFECLIRSVKILLDSGCDVSLVLVGEGGSRKIYESLIMDLNLEGRVVMTGYRQDVGAFLRGADILGMPSFFEGFGNVHLEAMYCGVPCVVSDVVPSLEIARSASLVCDFSPESCALKIKELINNPEKYKEISEEGRRIVQDYTIERCFERLCRVYRELVHDSAR